MNIFCVGFFMTSIQLNLSWFSNYIVKFVGLLFMLGGVFEMKEHNVGYKKLSPNLTSLISLTAVAAVIFGINNFVQINKTAVNILGLVIGGIVTVLIVLFQKKIMDLMINDKDLVNDFSNVKRLKATWQKLVYFTLAGLFFNVFNILPVSMIAALSGVGMAVCRIVMYIFALTMLVQFIKVRTDFYKYGNKT